MKSTFISSLLLTIYFFGIQEIRCQELYNAPLDSTSYFYKIILGPEDAVLFDKSVQFYKREYLGHLNKKEYLQAGRSLELIASGKYKIGDYTAAEELLIQALEITEDDTTSEALAMKTRIFNLLGLIYSSIKDYEKSLEFYYKSLDLGMTSKDTISALLHIGNVYRYEKNYDDALSTYNYALKIARDNNDIRKTGYLLDNLGYTELLAKKQSGLMHLNQSLEIRNAIKDTIGLYANYRHLSLYYSETADTTTALAYARQALSLSDAIKDPTYELEALGIIAGLDDTKYIGRYKFLNDSLKEADLEARNKYAALKYDVSKEQRQTKLALLQRDRQKRLNAIYLLGIAIGIVITIAIIIIMYQKRKQKQLEAIRITEAAISKKVHDGLANDTFQVLSELQNLKNVPDHIINRLDKIYMETRDISKNNSPLIEGANFKDQLVSRLNSYKTETFNVITRNLNAINWEKFNQNKRDAIYMVLGELMTNTKKHSQASLALITFEQKGKKLQIVFKDNGVGTKINKGNGIQNMEFRIFSLNGTISFDSELDKGLKVQIQV